MCSKVSTGLVEARSVEVEHGRCVSVLSFTYRQSIKLHKALLGRSPLSLPEPTERIKLLSPTDQESSRNNKTMAHEITYDFIEHVDPNLTCVICQSALVDPVTTTSCKHIFCRDCITQAINMTPSAL